MNSFLIESNDNVCKKKTNLSSVKHHLTAIGYQRQINELVHPLFWANNKKERHEINERILSIQIKLKMAIVVELRENKESKLQRLENLTSCLKMFKMEKLIYDECMNELTKIVCEFVLLKHSKYYEKREKLLQNILEVRSLLKMYHSLDEKLSLKQVC